MTMATTLSTREARHLGIGLATYHLYRRRGMGHEEAIEMALAARAKKHHASNQNDVDLGARGISELLRRWARRKPV